ncbi:glutathione S-transferase family protein [Solimonas marina]|uniref:Glutathione S-transferase family protein n=1 Tax=Solimonas marina TaxID=2714601 RepID=A0A969WAH5_9GAMM|nr:glutathione S-transferase family protein [Solimonas marina]NKF22549.1 glutathione S-transferase family protein [Solimonas marina]
MAEPAGKMRLYSALPSPYSRRVRVLIEELGLSEQVEEVEIDPYDPPADFLELNPLSKVPVLITEAGEPLLDSNLVSIYLLTRGHGIAALPSGARRWGALRRQYLAEGIMDAAAASTNEKRRPEGIIYQVFLDRQAAAIQRAIARLDAEAGELLQETPTTVEITLGCALGYLDLRMPYLEWRRGHDALAAWYATFSERPSMLKTASQGA